jgi:hypothetical protein
MTKFVYIEELDSDSFPVKKMTLRGRLRKFIKYARELHRREQQNLRKEISRVPGLMALLMKPRNGERWSAEDRAQLKVQLRGLGVISLYLMILVIPFTTVTLPLLAWWLDRRRWRRTSVPDENSLDKDTTTSGQ